MSKFKNRKIWGITIPLNHEMLNTPYINYGESRYGYIGWEEFLNFLPTVQIPTTGPRGGEQWVNLKDSVVLKKQLGLLSINYSDAEFLNVYFKNTYEELKGKVIVFKEGSYLIEHYEYIKNVNGKMKYKLIRNFKGRKIKFNLNGTDGFSVWRNNICLEDNLWSVNDCEEWINNNKLTR